MSLTTAIASVVYKLEGSASDEQIDECWLELYKLAKLQREVILMEKRQRESVVNSRRTR